MCDRALAVGTNEVLKSAVQFPSALIPGENEQVLFKCKSLMGSLDRGNEDRKEQPS